MILLETEESPYDFSSKSFLQARYDVSALTAGTIISVENARPCNSVLHSEEFINSIICTNFPLEKEYASRRYKTKDGIVYVFEDDIKYLERGKIDMKNSSFKVKIENTHTGQKIERKVSYPDFKVYSASGVELDEFNPYAWNFTASENGDIYFLDFALEPEIFQKELEENNYKKVPDFRVNLKCLKNNWKQELASSSVPQKVPLEKKSESDFTGFINFLKGKTCADKDGAK